MNKIIVIFLLFVGSAFAQVSNPTTQVSATNTTTNHTSTVTASWTAPANSLIIVTGAAIANDLEPDISISTTMTGLSWTEITASVGTRNTVSVFYAHNTSSQSGTITCSFSANADRSTVIVETVTGHDTSTPVAENNSATGSASTISAALTDLATNSLAYSSCLSRADTDGITPGTNETESTEVTGGGTNETRVQTQYNNAADVTLDNSGLNTNANIIIAIEISPAAATAVRRRTAIVF